IAAIMWRRSSQPAPTIAAPTAKSAEPARGSAERGSASSVVTSVRKIPAERRAHLLSELAKGRHPPPTGSPTPSPVARAGSNAAHSGWSNESDPTNAIALDRNYIRSAVRDIVPLLAECYSAALVRKPSLAGTVMVSFEIAGEPDIGGVITDSFVQPAGQRTVDDDGKQLPATTLDDAEVHECIRETMYAIEIDPPTHGGSVRVNYPLAFAPDSADR
ncbi:MAG: hypothetical protein AB7L28_28340, partial [Kofleriaceae bacterium]